MTLKAIFFNEDMMAVRQILVKLSKYSDRDKSWPIYLGDT